MHRKPWLLRGLITVTVAVAIALSSPLGMAQSPSRVLFENVRIFDGTSPNLSDPAYVLVEDDLIQAISAEPIAVTAVGELTTIDGNGRTLMPGLSDAHWHHNMALVDPVATLSPDMTDEEAEATVRSLSQQAAEDMLMRGFTSARDVGGDVFWLKDAIDNGELLGPRIWPSGAMISQTSGHFDFSTVEDIPRLPTSPISRTDRLGITMVADGVPEVLRRTREQLKRGAVQIKIATGGGVTSAGDPIDVSQYTEDEIKAAVDAAADWNTYVLTHAFTPRSIQRSIEMGVKSIEHGHLMDEETAQMMAETGTWLSMQPILDDEDALIPEGSPELQRGKFLQVAEGTDNTYRLAKQYNIKTAWGIDTLFSPELAARQGAQLSKMVRWYEPWEALKMATHDNHELFSLSGPRNPYPGTLGVVEEGSLADLLLVDGNPLENIELIEDPETNFVVIMKDGVIYKDLVS
jgi:imidazolonepropionase-like amidohydrolase